MRKISNRAEAFTDSVIRRMTRISDEYGAINLSQGFPDFDPPKEILDALCCNTPAHRLYEGLGFKKCGTQNWYAGNTGYIDFYLYEFVLD